MMYYSPVSNRTAGKPRSGPWATVLGLAVVTGLLVLAGFVAAPSRADAAEAPAGSGAAAASPALIGQAVNENGSGALGRSAPHPCHICGTTTTTTTEQTTTTGHPCHVCGTTTTTTTTTTKPTTTTTEHSTVPSTTTTKQPVGHAGNHHSSPPKLAYTGTSPVPLLAVGALLLILGTLLLFVIVPARARRRSTPPTD